MALCSASGNRAATMTRTRSPSPRTSNTPGRTQELIFFKRDDQLNLVDMPGYGYAAAAKTKVAAWTALIHAFLKGRANLARVYVLVDARHGLKPVDDDVLGRTLHAPGPFARLGATPLALPRRPPSPGEHNAAVLGALCGYGADELAALAREGIV